MTLPDCPHCDARETLKVEQTEYGSQFCECSCCSHRCRVDHEGRAQKVERKTDVSGQMIYQF